VFVGLGSPVAAGGLSTFGCSTAIPDSGSLAGPVLASINIAGVVSVVKGAGSALSISFGTSAVPIGFDLRAKTSDLFGFGTLEEVEEATFLFPLPLDRKTIIRVNKPNSIENYVQPPFLASTEGNYHGFVFCPRVGSK
jgi:hypothetical protein